MPTWRTARTPDRYTDGPLAATVIATQTGKITSRWQQYVLDVGLERIDGPGSPFAYGNVDVIVGRRCGKTITLMGVPLYRALAGPVRLDNGKIIPFAGAHTAQNLVKARQRFRKDLVEPFQQSMSPQMWRNAAIFRTAIGDTSLTIDPALSDWQHPDASNLAVFAPTKSSVRGDGLFHLGFDETLVFGAATGDELMASAGPTLSTLRGHGQIWRASNVSRLNDAKTWLHQLRDRGRKAVTEGRTTGTAYFEFTIPDDSDPDDESLWWEHYPALADDLVRVEELREDRDRLGRDSFAAEYLGRWPDQMATAAAWAAIAETDWQATVTDAEQPAGQPVAIGVDIDPFGRSSTITAATEHPEAPDGLLIEPIYHDTGSQWVPDAIRHLAARADVTAIAVDDYGPGHDLIGALRDSTDAAAKLMPVKTQAFSAACYRFDAGIRDRRIWHRASKPLDIAVEAAERTTGQAWKWERRVSVSQTPIVSATLAAWAMGMAPEQNGFFVF